MQLQQAIQGLHLDARFRRQPPGADKAQKTARAIAALLHLATISIVDFVLEVDPVGWRWQYRQHLIGPHAEVPVCQKAVLRRVQVQAGARLVQNHEIVACALHFGKLNSHAADYPFMLEMNFHPPCRHRKPPMRIPDWSAELKPQPQDLVDAVLNRRGGKMIELDHALLWSEPIARGWNAYMGAVRTGLPTSRKLRELGILCVAYLTGAAYEYKHHAPDFLEAGGTQTQLDALASFMAGNPRGAVADASFGAQERAVIEYAVQITLDVKVSDDAFATMKSHFDTTQIVEITTAIAAYNMVARILVPLGVGS